MARTRRPHGPASDATSGRVRSLKPAPAVWARALALAAGDARRLRVLPDGAVLVANARVR